MSTHQRMGLSHALGKLVSIISRSLGLVLLSLIVLLAVQGYLVQALIQKQVNDNRNLSNLNHQVALASETFHHWFLQPNPTSEENLKAQWREIWAALPVVDSTDKALGKSLSRALTKLELAHWRGIDYHAQGLSTASRSLQDEFMAPHADEVFAITTALIEQSQTNVDSSLLSVSADLRGFSRNTFAAHLDYLRTGDAYYWNEFLAAEDRLLLATEEARQLFADNEQILSATSLIEDFSHNAHTARKLLNDMVQYTRTTSSLTIADNTKQVLTILEDIDLHLQDSQFQQHLAIWLSAFVGVIIMAMVAAVGHYSLRKYQAKLNAELASPIKAIISQADSIATGDEHYEHVDHDIAELNELGATMNQIQSVVRQNSLTSRNRLELELTTNSIGLLANESNSLEAFCQSLADFLAERYCLLSVAIYSHADSGEEFVLMGAYNPNPASEIPVQGRVGGIAAEVQRTGRLIDEAPDPGSAYWQDHTCVQVVRQHLVIPAINNKHIEGVVELSTAREPLDSSLYLHLADRIAECFTFLKSRLLTEALLKQTEYQKEGLKLALEKVTEQSIALQQSERALEQKAAELKERNDRISAQQSETLAQKSELEILNQELKLAAEELAKASEQKSSFLSRISHELKTPLNSIMILTQSLIKQGAEFSKSQRESLEVIHYSGTDLASLINDLLDLARIEAGEMKIFKDMVPVKFLAERLEKQFAPVAERDGIGWRVTVRQSDLSIYTDVKRLSQILRNFLSNAFKFTSEGEVELMIDQQDDITRFSVSDTGIGIREEDQSRIFESFKQVDERVNRAYNGTGLGLSICLQLADYLDGTIDVESTPGEGSKFTFSLPLEVPAETSVDTAVQASQFHTSVQHRGNDCLLIAEPGTEIERELTEKNIVDSLKRVSLDSVLQIDLQAYREIFLYLPITEKLFVEEARLNTLIRKVTQARSVHLLVDRRLPKDFRWIETTCKSLVLWNSAGQERLRLCLAEQQESDGVRV